jgi:hypothetical protein
VCKARSSEWQDNGCAYATMIARNVVRGVDPQDQMSLLNLGAIIAELNELPGIRVDFATSDALPDAMRQRVWRDAILI